MLERYLIVWLVLSSGLAFFWQDWIPGGWDPFIYSRPALDYLIAATMFSIGCLLPRDEIRQVVKRWPTVLGGTALQYTAMPLLAYMAAEYFQFDAETRIGVILVGCVPGAMASNVLTLNARGNVSYSVSLTTSATLLSPLIVPAALLLTLGSRHGPDPREVFENLALTVAGPVLAGHLLSRAIPRFQRFMQPIGPVIANVAILFIIAVVVALNRERLATPDRTLLLALLMVNILGYAAGFFGGTLLRLPSPMRRALTLEIGMQNAGVGAVLAGQIFATQPAIAVPPALYMFGCMMTGTVLARLWATRRAGPHTI